MQQREKTKQQQNEEFGCSMFAYLPDKELLVPSRTNGLL